MWKSAAHKSLHGRVPRDTAILVLTTLVIFCTMSLLLPGTFLSPYNIQSMMFTGSEMGLLGLAMMISMVPGGIDLSLVAIANLTGIVAGIFFHFAAARTGRPIADLGPLTAIGGYLVALAVGLVGGAVNGLLVARVGITPLLATIGSSQLFMGICLVITGGPAIENFPPAWKFLGDGTVGAIPMPVIVMIVFFCGAGIAFHRTAPGFSALLVGTNARAALFSGIRIKGVMFGTFVATGLIASIAGILLSARTNAAKADYGSSYLLLSVLVAVLGGADPGGGRVAVVGTAVALVALTLLSSGFQMMRFSNFTVEFIWGAFLLGVLAIHRLQQLGEAGRFRLWLSRECRTRRF